MREIMCYHKADFQVHSQDWGALWSRSSCVLTDTHTASLVQMQQDVLWVPSVSGPEEEAPEQPDSFAGYLQKHLFLASLLSWTPAYLQVLIHQKHSRFWLAHTSFTHLLSEHTGDPIDPFFYACTGYSVFMWHRAESIWPLQLQQQQRVSAGKTALNVLLLTDREVRMAKYLRQPDC